MNNSTAIVLFLLMAFVVANLPWLSNRLFMLLPLQSGKSAWYCLAEWLVWYLLMGAVSAVLEWRAYGVIYPQDWEFYVVTFFLFVVFAFPGFVLHYEIKRFWCRS